MHVLRCEIKTLNFEVLKNQLQSLSQLHRTRYGDSNISYLLDAISAIHKDQFSVNV